MDTIKLTRREVEVLTLIAEGNDTKTTARMLYVSPRTVSFHLVNIYKKLEASNRIQTILRAQKAGLMEVTL